MKTFDKIVLDLPEISEKAQRAVKGGGTDYIKTKAWDVNKNWLSLKNNFKLLIYLIIFSTNVSNAQSVTFMRTANSNTAVRIMKTLYGNYNPKMNNSTWRCEDTTMLNQYSIKNKFEFLSTIWSCDSLIQNGLKSYYCIISSVPNDFEFQCHECGAIEEFVIFNVVGNQIKLFYKKQFAKFGNFGTSPFFKITRAGDKLYYFFNPGRSSAGITSIDIALFVYDKSEFRKILFIKEAAETNEDNCNKKAANSCYNYDYIEKFSNYNIAYSDLVITKTGTIKKAGKVIKANATQHYVFDGSQYSIRNQ